MAPLILIVGRIANEAAPVRGEAFAAGQRYCRSVQRSGGLPVIVPPIGEMADQLDQLVARADGLVLHGGGDIDPRRYGQTPTAEQIYGIVPDHDEIELGIAAAAVEAGVPVLAICRGMQVLNVALGGTLVQDIGSEDHWHGYRDVALAPDSQLAHELGVHTVTHCHCVHHQALDRIADPLRAVGHDATDGVIHAVELAEPGWVFGVQWHPEDTALHDSGQQRLFDGLVAAAAIHA